MNKHQKIQHGRIIKGQSTYSKAIREEIRRHRDKGRDTGTIAIWMNLPVSTVAEVLKSL